MCSKLLLCLAFLALAVAPASAQDAPKKYKPLSEKEIIQLIQTQIADEAIVLRIQQGGLSFKVDDEVLKRIQKARPNDPVLDVIKSYAPKNATPVDTKLVKGPMTLWVKKYYDSQDCALNTELSINGKTIDTFASERIIPVENYLKKGENVITLRTFQKGEAAQWNALLFHFGPAYKRPDNGQTVMEPEIWLARNDTDWELKNGKFTHTTNPNAKEVTLNFKVFYGDLEKELIPLRGGDYQLDLNAYYNSVNAPLTAAVWVNDQLITSPLIVDRKVVISSFLKQGKNEIKLVTYKVKDSLKWNDITIAVAGPAEWVPAQKKYVLRPIVEAKAMTAWEQHKTTGQLTNRQNAAAETEERILTFNLEEAPKITED